MNGQSLKQILPIMTKVELDALGYAPGSFAHCVVNTTGPWVRAWFRDIEREEGESDVDYEKRVDELLHPLIPYAVHELHLITPERTMTVPFRTLAEVKAWIAHGDPRVLPLAITEAYQRRQDSVMKARADFRAQRLGLASSTQSPAARAAAIPIPADVVPEVPEVPEVPVSE